MQHARAAETKASEVRGQFAIRPSQISEESQDDFDGGAFRAVYTVRFADVVYVLHAFQKKSKKGIETPKSDIDLINHRLEVAEQGYKSGRK